MKTHFGNVVNQYRLVYLYVYFMNTLITSFWLNTIIENKYSSVKT